MTSTNEAVILIVEDEPDVAETYELWLDDEYDVQTASDGHEALEVIDETVDVVLLDRMMPGMAGETVLEEIRDRGLGCRVAMVTAVDPDFDVVEMGFDEYITKPPSREQLRETIERLLERATLDDELQEYYSLVSRRSALQTQKSADELDASDEYDALCERIEGQRAEVDTTLGDMTSDRDFVGAVRELTVSEEPSESTADSNHSSADSNHSTEDHQ